METFEHSFKMETVEHGRLSNSPEITQLSWVEVGFEPEFWPRGLTLANTVWKSANRRCTHTTRLIFGCFSLLSGLLLLLLRRILGHVADRLVM